MKKGFLGSLHPFCGELYEENFFEVMECLKVLKDEFSKVTIEQRLELFKNQKNVLLAQIASL